MQNQRKNPSQSEWDEWKEGWVTKYFFEFLEKEANSRRQAMGMGVCKSASILETGQAYNDFLVQAQTYEQVSKIELDDTLEEVVDEDNAGRA